jgi:hypothetical protein
VGLTFSCAGAGAVEKLLQALARWRKDSGRRHGACSLGLSATSQQYFSLRTNQPPATSRNQPAVLFSKNKPASAISHQPTEQAHGLTPLHSRSRETLSCKEGAPLFN